MTWKWAVAVPGLKIGDWDTGEQGVSEGGSYKSLLGNSLALRRVLLKSTGETRGPGAGEQHLGVRQPWAVSETRYSFASQPSFSVL